MFILIEKISLNKVGKQFYNALYNVYAYGAGLRVDY